MGQGTNKHIIRSRLRLNLSLNGTNRNNHLPRRPNYLTFSIVRSGLYYRSVAQIPNGPGYCGISHNLTKQQDVPFHTWNNLFRLMSATDYNKKKSVYFLPHALIQHC